MCYIRANEQCVNYDCRDKLRYVPEQFNKAVGRKQYLQASEMLMSSLQTWDSDLEQIEGLRDIYTDLKIKKTVSIAKI